MLLEMVVKVEILPTKDLTSDIEDDSESLQLH